MSTINLHDVDCLEGLRELPAESVHCCVTSPPYWGLRDYKIKPQIWDDPGDCEHEWYSDTVEAKTGTGGNWQQAKNGDELKHGRHQTRFKGDTKKANQCETVIVNQGFCRKCGAWKGNLGLEPTPELYVQHIVTVFREVKRVLRNDGTLWLNIADTYSGGKIGRDDQQDFYLRTHGYESKSLTEASSRKPIEGIKEKNLVGVPWLVALALRADGWYLRDSIIWYKSNPMPESVKDRCTKSHEYIFLFAKCSRYYYDAFAIREPASYGGNEARDSRAQNGHKSNPDDMRNGIRPRESVKRGGFSGKTNALKGREASRAVTETRNKRSVWPVPTKPFKDAHFATYPEELIEPCILAGTSAEGCCSSCGSPLVRVLNDKQQTIRWDKSCKCSDNKTAPCLVLDPFAGSGTTAVVAARGFRDFVGYEISPEYIEIARNRIKQTVKESFFE